MDADHRPLLVKHQEKGYRVCDICFNDEQTLEVGPMSLAPALEFVNYRPLAVSPGGTCIMGVVNNPSPAGAADGIIGNGTAGNTIMLPVGNDTIIRMDKVIYAGGNSRFEMLRLVFPGADDAVEGGNWCTVPLPRPPLRTLAPLQTQTLQTQRHSVSSSVSISSYFVMGTSVWISVTGEGTFSLDAQRGTWRMEFPEELRRLEGRAFFAPELGAVVGLTGGDRLLCAYKFSGGKDGSRTLTWHNTWREAVPGDCFECLQHGYAPTSDMVGLAYLGHGRFCLCRPVQKMGATSTINMYSFLVLELRRRRCSPDGDELELARRGKINCQGIFIGEYTRDLYFIQ